jgi:hypothetical protein
MSKMDTMNLDLPPDSERNEVGLFQREYIYTGQHWKEALQAIRNSHYVEAAMLIATDSKKDFVDFDLTGFRVTDAHTAGPCMPICKLRE